MSYSFDGFDLTASPYNLRSVEYGHPPRNITVAEYASRDGGEIGRVRDGSRQVQMIGQVTGTSASNLEANLDTLRKTLNTDTPRRLVSSEQDGRFWLAVLSSFTERRSGPLLTNIALSFTCKGPYQFAPAGSASLSAPTLAAVTAFPDAPGGSNAYGATLSLSPGGTVPAPMRLLLVNQSGGVTPTQWMVLNRTGMAGQFDPSMWPGLVTTESIAAGNCLLFDGVNLALVKLSFSSVVGYWPLQDNSGNPLDLSSNSRDATSVSGSPTYGADGPLGLAMTFNGSSDAIRNTAAALELTGQVCLGAWVKPTALGTGMVIASRAVFQKGYGLFKTSGDVFQFEIGNGSGSRTATGTTVAVSGRWYYVEGCLDGSGNVYIYVNGRPEGKTAGGAYTPAGSVGNDLYIGFGSSPAGNTVTYWTGSIAEVSLRSSAPTAAQAYNAFKTDWITALGTKIMPSNGQFPELDPRLATANSVLIRADHATTAATLRAFASWRARYAA